MSRELQSTNWLTLLVFLITGYFIVFVQARVDWFRDLTGVQPDLLPGMIVFAAMAFPLATVMLCAGVFGLFFDSFSSNAMGTAFLSLAVIGFFA